MATARTRSVLPFSAVIVATVLVVAVLVVALRDSNGAGSSADAQPAPTVAQPAPTDEASEPAVNGSARPPLPADEQQAVEKLAVTSHALPDELHSQHGHLFGHAPEVPVSAADAARLRQEWAEASAASERLRTPAEAAAAGYVLASTTAPGVGEHWVNWGLIAQPFDPARPAMLLFATERDVDRLVGFSYWVQGDQPPQGFAGPNDQWHTHQGLCIVNGWVDREEVPIASACAGQWLQGDDLWMLHAWVVPDFPNIWGQFAQTNPRLCPKGGPDILRCDPSLG